MSVYVERGEFGDDNLLETREIKRADKKFPAQTWTGNYYCRRSVIVLST